MQNLKSKQVLKYSLNFYSFVVFRLMLQFRVIFGILKGTSIEIPRLLLFTLSESDPLVHGVLVTHHAVFKIGLRRF